MLGEAALSQTKAQPRWVMRRLGSIVAALCITLALFALMQAMIAREEAPIEPIRSDAGVSLVAPPADTEADVAEDAAAASAAEASLPAPPEPPPLPAAPPPPVPASTPPPLAPPPAIEPELARIEPGAKPYLGAVAKPKPKPKPKPEPKARPKPKAKPAPAPRPKARPAPQRPQATAPARSGASRSGDQAAGGSAQGRAAKPQPKPKPKAQGVTRAASAISTPQPSYPQAARRARQEGWVDVQFTITASGRVTGVRVVGSSPRGVFDQSALRTVQRWRFRPRMVNGKATSQSTRQRIYFRLR
jgi:protein TonB